MWHITADGKGGVYKHGEVTKMWRLLKPFGLISIVFPKQSFRKTTYELLSDEDFENITN